jgi:hypothetical protein
VLHVTERRGQEVDCRVVVLPLKQHWCMTWVVLYNTILSTIEIFVGILVSRNLFWRCPRVCFSPVGRKLSVQAVPLRLSSMFSSATRVSRHAYIARDLCRWSSGTMAFEISWPLTTGSTVL